MTAQPGADNRPVVVLADDEPDVLGAVAPFLERSGLRVITAPDGRLALDEIRRHKPDVCVLDVLMPGADGREVLRTLRREENWVPVLLLTQVGEAVERAMALEEGADDYLNKPFDPHELVARIRAVLRRTHSLEEDEGAVVQVGDLELDDDTHEVRRGGILVDLSPTEFKLLRYLMLNANRVLSKSQILDHVWEYDFGGDTGIVESYISYLRRKIDTAPETDEAGNPVQAEWRPMIQTKRGVGYMLRTPETK